MLEDSETSPTLPASLRRGFETLLRTLQNRAELVGLEVEEEGRWLLSALVWVVAAVFFGVLAVTTVTITAVLLSPEAARPWVLMGFSVIYIFLTFSAISGVKKHFKNRRAPLADTVNELKKDLDWIQSRD